MNIELQEAFELADLKHKIRMTKKKEKNRRSRLAQQNTELSFTTPATFDLASLFDVCRSDPSPPSINIVPSNDQPSQAHPRFVVDLLDDSIDFVDEMEEMESASIGFDQQIEENSDSGSDLDSEESSQMQLVQSNETLHPYTNVATNSFCHRLFQLFRKSKVSKREYQKFIELIGRALPNPNNFPANTNELLKVLQMENSLFTTRKLCLRCEQELADGVICCSNCPSSNTSEIIFIYQADVQFILSVLLKRLWKTISENREQIRNQNDLFNTNDIGYCQAYQHLLNRFPDENFITALLHLDGVGLCKSSKLKMWLFSFSIVELPARFRYRRFNMPVVSLWIGFKEPTASLWLKKSVSILEELKVAGIALLFLKFDCESV